jgi:hypothetical protein
MVQQLRATCGQHPRRSWIRPSALSLVLATVLATVMLVAPFLTGVPTHLVHASAKIAPLDAGSGYSTKDKPSIALWNNKFWLAWTGNSNNSLYLIGSTDAVHWGSSSGCTYCGLNQTFHTMDTSTLMAPALAVFNGRLYVAGVQPSTHQIYVGYLSCTSTGCNHTLSGCTVLGNTTAASPSLASDGSYLYVTYAGRDASHHLNYRRFNGSSWSSTIVGSDTTVAGPGSAYFNGAVYFAWAGTDSSHLIWYGSYSGGPGLNNHGHLPSPDNTNVGFDVSLAVFTGTTPAKMFVVYAHTPVGDPKTSYNWTQNGTSWSPTGVCVTVTANVRAGPSAVAYPGSVTLTLAYTEITYGQIWTAPVNGTVTCNGTIY